MQTLLLRAEDLSALLDRVGRDELMDRMLDALRTRFEEHDPDVQQARARDGFRYDKPAHGLVEWMPTHEIGGPVTIKMVGYHPTNPVQRQIPSVIATTSMWDTTTGHLVAVADSTLLTALRTGAASGVATDVFAVDRPIELGVVGMGAQAVTQVHAISRVREITKIVGFDTDPDVAASFAERIAWLDVPVETLDADAGAQIAGMVDVLCTCTSADIGAPPVIAATDVRPWLHINAVGADFPGKIELPVEFGGQAFVVPDTIEQCLVEGECQQVPADHIGPELPEIVQRATEFTARRCDFTIFDSTGWAVEDDVALRLAVQLAEHHGVGLWVELERLPEDPYNPYADR